MMQVALNVLKNLKLNYTITMISCDENAKYELVMLDRPRNSYFSGASVIKCWCLVPNLPACYSLGRHLSVIVLLSTRPTHREETTLSQPRVFVARQRRVPTHHPLRILPNHGRKTASLPMSRMRPDVLVDERHALLPSPAPANDVRHGRHAPR